MPKASAFMVENVTSHTRGSRMMRRYSNSWSRTTSLLKTNIGREEIQTLESTIRTSERYSSRHISRTILSHCSRRHCNPLNLLPSQRSSQSYQGFSESQRVQRAILQHRPSLWARRRRRRTPTTLVSTQRMTMSTS